MIIIRYKLDFYPSKPTNQDMLAKRQPSIFLSSFPNHIIPPYNITVPVCSEEKKGVLFSKSLDSEWPRIAGTWCSFLLHA